MNIEGAWTGTIVLGESYGDNSGAATYFDLDIVQEGDHITGTAVDIAGAYINPYPAFVEGTLNGKDITFVKQYEALHYLEEDGLTIQVDASRKGLYIHYSGDFDEAEQMFRGVWMMRERRMLLGTERTEYTFAASEGRWYMHRK